MHATDVKTQIIKTDPNFFDGRKFRRQCANVIDTTWGRIYFLTCENVGRKFRTKGHCTRSLKFLHAFFSVFFRILHPFLSKCKTFVRQNKFRSGSIFLRFRICCMHFDSEKQKTHAKISDSVCNGLQCAESLMIHYFKCDPYDLYTVFQSLLKNESVFTHRRKKVIQVWNMMANKWWQNIHILGRLVLWGKINGLRLSISKAT